MSDVKRESPLVGQSDAVHGAETGARAGVALGERPFLGHINLRGDPEDKAFLAACREALGVDLPASPNTVVEGESVVVAWLGPNEWLVMSEPDAQGTFADTLRTKLGELHWAVTDVSGGQTLVVVSGDHAAEVLAKGTPLDLHPRVFGAGRCAQTVVAKSAAFIRVIEPGRAFEVVVRRSFADYLWQWLRDAADEYGCAVPGPEASLQLTAVPSGEESAPKRATR